MLTFRFTAEYIDQEMAHAVADAQKRLGLSEDDPRLRTVATRLKAALDQITVSVSVPVPPAVG